MKDTHVDRPAPGKIPVISPVLHCVTMTALVYLRSSFGLALFRPRTIFFAFSFAVAVLDYIAWNEPDIWRAYRAACIFSAGAVVLYWLHFAITFFGELYPESEDDDYSGTSHVFRVLRRLGYSSPVAEMNVHLWIEPVTVLAVAAALRLAFHEQHLSSWLVLVAPCMIFKEFLNYWTENRLKRITERIKKHAEKLDEGLGRSRKKVEAPEPTRTGKQTMKRTVVLSPEEERELRFADILGIAEPHDLEEAETNFRERIQLTHPDTHGNSPENHARSVDLNEAIEFFRKKLAG